MLHAIILLAAGASTRLGQPKQLLIYQGQTLLRRAAETAVAASATVVVVTGAEHEALLPELAGLPVRVSHNPQWERGMGSSLKVGLAALEAETESAAAAVIAVMLCDQPFVTPKLLKQLAEARIRTGKPMVACEYADVRGVPVLFAAEALPLLRTLPDTAGAGQLLKQHPELVATVPFALGSVDVDTIEQYEALLRGEGPSSSATS